MNRILEQLNLEDDFLFAKVMSDKEICRKVLEKILNIKIKHIEMPTQQKVIDILLDSKAVRLDIYVNDENNTIYNVEMQKGKYNNLAKRSRYYPILRIQQTNLYQRLRAYWLNNFTKK